MPSCWSFTIRACRIASLLSLPPDLLVYLPGHGMQRLNAAYALGGYELLSLTLEYNLGIRPDRYALVPMNEFAAFVNQIGGVYMDVLRPYNTPWGILAPGHIFMTGEQLLFFAMLRDGTTSTPRCQPEPAPAGNFPHPVHAHGRGRQPGTPA